MQDRESPYDTESGMENLTGHARADAVRDIFTRIAPRYDLMNRVMTGGMDRRWREFVIQQAAIPTGGRMLDIATGTGDIALEALARVDGVMAVGADFAPRMMLVGQCRPNGNRVRWAAADALHLPFADRRFDAVTHGFLVR